MKSEGAAPSNQVPATATDAASRVLRPVTSVDVARAAGVSQATVSRVFAPGSRIAGPMREKVLAAAVALGYRPNAIARSLASQRSGMIGIVMGNLRNPFYPQVLELFGDMLRRTGRQVLLFTVRDGENVDDLLPELLQYQVDGVVIASANLSSGMARSCAALGTPVVLFNRTSKDAEVASVCCENRVGGRLAAEVLAQAGHRRLTFLAGTADTSTNAERLVGFTERCGELGLPPPLVEPGAYTHEAGFDAMARAIRGGRPPDGVFCANDIIALGALDAARQGGLVPGQAISVLGFDDIAPATWPNYRLTTIRQDTHAMVRHAVQALTERAGVSAGPQVAIRVAPEIVWRDTVRRP